MAIDCYRMHKKLKQFSSSGQVEMSDKRKLLLRKMTFTIIGLLIMSLIVIIFVLMVSVLNCPDLTYGFGPCKFGQNILIIFTDLILLYLVGLSQKQENATKTETSSIKTGKGSNTGSNQNTSGSAGRSVEKEESLYNSDNDRDIDHSSIGASEMTRQ